MLTCAIDSRRPTRLARVERGIATRAIVCFAVEETEVWMLALHRDLYPHGQSVRARTGRGRRAAMRKAAAQRWRGLLRVCDELETLERAIAATLESAN